MIVVPQACGLNSPGAQEGSIALKDFQPTSVLMNIFVYCLFSPMTIILLQMEVVVASLLNELMKDCLEEDLTTRNEKRLESPILLTFSTQETL